MSCAAAFDLARRARASGRLVPAALLGATLVTDPALAQTSRPRLVEGDVTLAYHLGEGAAGCPAESALRERVADAFDFHDPFVPSGRRATSHMRVEISGAQGTFRGTVSIVDARGVTLATSSEQHADCDALVWVIGHRVALAILRRTASTTQPAARSQPDASSSPSSVAAPDAAAASASTSSPAPSSTAPSSPAQTPSSTPASTRPPASAPAPALRASTPAGRPSPPVCDDRCLDGRGSKALAIEVAAGPLFTVGLTADVGPGVWLAASVRRDWFSVGIEARGVLPAVTITYEPGRSSYATTLSGLVAPCVRWKILAGCAFVEVGSFLFTIPGHSSAELSALVSLGPRAAVEIPLFGGLSVRVLGELALHPYLPVFHVRTSSAPDARVETWVTPIASGVFAAGLAFSP